MNACLNIYIEKFCRTDLLFAELHHTVIIPALKVPHKSVLRIKAGGWALQQISINRDFGLEYLLPCFGCFYNIASDSFQGCRIGVVDASSTNAESRLQVQVETGNTFVAATCLVWKLSSRRHFERSFILRKACVALNAEHRSTNTARVCNEVFVDLFDLLSKVSDKPQHWFFNFCDVSALIGIEPRAVVVCLEFAQEPKQTMIKVGTLCSVILCPVVVFFSIIFQRFQGGETISALLTQDNKAVHDMTYDAFRAVKE
jgi:hypothetical protein